MGLKQVRGRHRYPVARGVASLPPFSQAREGKSLLLIFLMPLDQQDAGGGGAVSLQSRAFSSPQAAPPGLLQGRSLPVAGAFFLSFQERELPWHL